MSRVWRLLHVAVLLVLSTQLSLASDLNHQIKKDYEAHLGDLFEWFSP